MTVWSWTYIPPPDSLPYGYRVAAGLTRRGLLSPNAALTYANLRAAGMSPRAALIYARRVDTVSDAVRDARRTPTDRRPWRA